MDVIPFHKKQITTLYNITLGSFLEKLCIFVIRYHVYVYFILTLSFLLKEFIEITEYNLLKMLHDNKPP